MKLWENEPLMVMLCVNDSHADYLRPDKRFTIKFRQGLIHDLAIEPQSIETTRSIKVTLLITIRIHHD